MILWTIILIWSFLIAMVFYWITIDLIFEKELGKPLPKNFRADIKHKVLDRYRTEL
jgi:hypothetical protein